MSLFGSLNFIAALLGEGEHRVVALECDPSPPATGPSPGRIRLASEGVVILLRSRSPCRKIVTSSSTFGSSLAAVRWALDRSRANCASSLRGNRRRTFSISDVADTREASGPGRRRRFCSIFSKSYVLVGLSDTYSGR